MQKVFRLTSLLPSRITFVPRTLHTTRPLINHTFQTKAKLDPEFPIKPAKTNLASQAKRYANEFNEAIVEQDLEPLIKFIFSEPKTGIKRKEIHVHPPSNKGKFKISEEELNHKVFMDLKDEHVRYLESEGFNVEYKTYNESQHESVGSSRYYVEHHDYPYYCISWYDK